LLESEPSFPAPDSLRRLIPSVLMLSLSWTVPTAGLAQQFQSTEWLSEVCQQGSNEVCFGYLMGAYDGLLDGQYAAVSAIGISGDNGISFSEADEITIRLNAKVCAVDRISAEQLRREVLVWLSETGGPSPSIPASRAVAGTIQEYHPCR